mmetsp:Transcript_122393/g.341468  ORF Transcript_122393/g.341468 Transcript_122393/m.341468 type:complete len:257 (+) Transcript_122393:2-772(+)
MDPDGDGRVDRQEFMLASRDILDANGQDDEAFRSFVYRLVGALYDVADMDDDGVLVPSEVEFAELLIKSRSQMMHDGQGSDSELDQEFGGAGATRMLQQLDTNADYKVEVDEFALAFRVAMRRYGAWPDAVFDTPSVREALQATFARADVGGDGALNARELQFAMFLVNKFAVGEMTTDIMDFVDVNRDGRLSHEEAVQAVEGARQQMTRRPARAVIAEVLLDAFSFADTDGDGLLDIEEAGLVAEYLLPEMQVTL